jgi:hypothetical protein
MYNPPFTSNTAPVIYWKDRGEEQHGIGMSSGVPKRPNGMVSWDVFRIGQPTQTLGHFRQGSAGTYRIAVMLYWPPLSAKLLAK